MSVSSVIKKRKGNLLKTDWKNLNNNIELKKDMYFKIEINNKGSIINSSKKQIIIIFKLIRQFDYIIVFHIPYVPRSKCQITNYFIDLSDTLIKY